MDTQAQNILPGFSEPVQQSQQTFRKVLDAMSHPGRIVKLDDTPEGPETLSAAATAVCLTLLDFETPVWLDKTAEQGAGYLKFHCNCPITDLSTSAQFAVIGDANAIESLERFNLGSNNNPERAATLIVEVSHIDNEADFTLSGPGIKDQAYLNIQGISDQFKQLIAENNLLFPRGLDFIFTCGHQLVAIPRSTQIALKELEL